MTVFEEGEGLPDLLLTSPFNHVEWYAPLPFFPTLCLHQYET